MLKDNEARVLGRAAALAHRPMSVLLTDKRLGAQALLVAVAEYKRIAPRC